MRIHKLISNALLRLLMEKHLNNHSDLVKQFRSMEITTEEQHEVLVRSKPFTEFVDSIVEVISSSKLDMAKFWLSYITDIKI